MAGFLLGFVVFVAQARPCLAVASIADPAWKLSVVGMIIPARSTSRNRVVLGTTLLTEIERLSPGILVQLDGLWDQATPDQRKQIQSLLEEKSRAALLSLALSANLDQQAQAMGLILDPSEDRVSFALRSLLMQTAVEGPLSIPAARASGLSDSQLFQVLQDSMNALIRRSEGRGESYIELRLDQNWDNAYLGRFADSIRPQGRAVDFPPLAFEFRCGKLDQGWTPCFPESLDDLRKHIKKQLTSAYRTTLRKEFFQALLFQINPRLDMDLRVALPRDVDQQYEAQKSTLFAARKVTSQVATLQSADGSPISGATIEALLQAFQGARTTGPAAGSLIDQLGAAAQKVSKDQGMALDVAATVFSAFADQDFGAQEVSEAEAFGRASASLECNGHFSMLPCQISRDGRKVFFLLDRNSTATDRALPLSDRRVRSMVEQMVKSEKYNQARLAVASKLLERGWWLSIPGVTEEARRGDGPWPAMRDHRTITNSEAFGRVKDWLSILDALPGATLLEDQEVK
jgi:hypothetical protein